MRNVSGAVVDIPRMSGLSKWSPGYNLKKKTKQVFYSGDRLYDINSFCPPETKIYLHEFLSTSEGSRRHQTFAMKEMKRFCTDTKSLCCIKLDLTLILHNVPQPQISNV